MTADEERKLVALVRGMRRRGDQQMWIGTWIGMNQSRVSEIISGKAGMGKRHRDVKPLDPGLLPPQGPYVVITTRQLSEGEKALQVAQAMRNELVKLLRVYDIDISGRGLE